MKILSTEITPFINSSFFIDWREGNILSCPFHTQPSFHTHPELELVYIIAGYGKRIIGNRVETFNSGDMVFIGSNIPHVWLSDKAFYEKKSNITSKAIVVYVSPKIFSDTFKNIGELSTINSMVEKASRGIDISGETREVIANRLISSYEKTGYEKFETIMQIMHIISVSRHTSYILDDKSIPALPQSEDRLINVIKYIQSNLAKSITLNDLAEITCMTEQSFCRYFKKRTNKPFSKYLLERRLEYAYQLLIETDKSISDIAFLCGYNAPSRFSQLFKQEYGESPLQRRNAFRKVLQVSNYLI